MSRIIGTGDMYEAERDRERQGKGCEGNRFGYMVDALQETSNQFSFLDPTNRESNL